MFGNMLLIWFVQMEPAAEGEERSGEIYGCREKSELGETKS